MKKKTTPDKAVPEKAAPLRRSVRGTDKTPKTSYTIRVDYDVYELLKKDAEGFTDSPNDVIRRKLGMKPKQTAEDVNQKDSE